MNPNLRFQRPAALSWFLFGIVFLMILTTLYGEFFFGTRQYFSFLDIATVGQNDIPLSGLLLRLAMPLVTGLIIGIGSKANPRVEAAVAGFAAALLISWPVLFFPNLRPYLISLSLRSRTILLYTIYALFMLSYASLALIGAMIATYFRSFGAAGPEPAAAPEAGRGSGKEMLYAVIGGLLTNVLWLMIAGN